MEWSRVDEATPPGGVFYHKKVSRFVVMDLPLICPPEKNTKYYIHFNQFNAIHLIHFCTPFLCALSFFFSAIVTGRYRVVILLLFE